jgi:hypothetical protein
MRLVLAVAAAAVLVTSAGAPAARSPSAPCARGETRAVVGAFVRAWTQGDLATIRRLAAPEPHFRWVSSGRPGLRAGPSAFDRRSLAAYIARRHALHERLTITSFRFNGSDLRGKERFGHFALWVARDADDWPAAWSNHAKSGKGAIICNLDRPMLAVFSLG